jgi:hypothetical protein
MQFIRNVVKKVVNFCENLDSFMTKKGLTPVNLFYNFNLLFEHLEHLFKTVTKTNNNSESYYSHVPIYIRIMLFLCCCFLVSYLFSLVFGFIIYWFLILSIYLYNQLIVWVWWVLIWFPIFYEEIVDWIKSTRGIKSISNVFWYIRNIKTFLKTLKCRAKILSVRKMKYRPGRTQQIPPTFLFEMWNIYFKFASFINLSKAGVMLMSHNTMFFQYNGSIWIALLWVTIVSGIIIIVINLLIDLRMRYRIKAALEGRRLPNKWRKRYIYSRWAKLYRQVDKRVRDWIAKK